MRNSAQTVRQLRDLERTCLSAAESCVMAESRAAFRELALTYDAEARKIGSKLTLAAHQTPAAIYARVRRAFVSSPRRLKFTSF